MTMSGQDVTRMAGHESTRWEYQTKRDNRLFEQGWFADFRSRWQADLKREHLNFIARLEVIQ